MGAIPTQRDIVSCASDAPARVGSESLHAAPAHAGLDRRATAHLSLPGGPLAPGAARRFVSAALAEWAGPGLPGAAALPARAVEDALVVVSELVTNAVVHAGTDVELFCRLGRDAPAAAGWLLLEVSDHHPSREVRSEGAERPYLLERPYGAAEYGRGLRLVAALSEAWGITYRTGAKTVWARLSVDGAMAVEGAEGVFEPYGGDAGGSAAQGAEGAEGYDAGDARAYAGGVGPGQDVDPGGLVAPVPRPGGEHDREWLNRGALSFLAEASDLLTGQLDEDLVAALAGQLLVPRLADWCAVWLEEEGLGWRGGDGSLGPAPRLARVWHGSENRIEELRRALEKNPPRLPDSVRSRAVPVPWPTPAEDGGSFTGEAVAGAEEEAVAQAQDDAAAQARDEAIAQAEDEALAQAGDEATASAGGEPGAALAYRLIAGGRPLGTLVIGRAGLPRFPDEVTGLVEDLSRRIALSIGAARQYARQATISRVLQRGLLPGAVAEIPGVSSALVYEPCDKGGPSGDFYDLFPAGRGRWCFAIGDVQGKGPEAAVVIGLARPWLRLLAREGYGVADVLDRLNQLLLDDATEAADAAARALVTAGDPGLVDPDGPQTRFLSLLYGELVPVDGGVRCTLASAGHPLPLLLGPDGDVRAVAEPQTLLGVIEDTAYVSETFELRRGDTLLCVTDGVTERRSGPRMFDDEDGLATALSGCAGLDAELTAERIRRLVHEFGDRPPDDDLALLVLRAE
ncbi:MULTISPECIES: ATP-binding SpoIIE family protein phosphatase [Streptomyces]|uniref:ATP-binding SpoIIE family protein phosphatase n=1 Tax=Streptomyces scabiei TaxID=1930 RepID=UPI0004E7B8DE|nr:MULTISPECIES: ATP-binding SpoIIE family protein phosphatase [Streptomyces]MBP5867266.1 SpoIIE family protein phosphatase [Streptomyces sp. LBUM 1485]KFG09823.1 protein phosphatase [Streptomyces scabiei]MBP5893732.1 SpoIIE family protein phosphatase [Streptomyces sp. LBUM 1481]MBP5899468.1 SpoIIE family protein phosphatase [Streptomyces sp. LBUM 1488]MBP5916945.1 SpoIIE family protein phosphatase [Streptomyces sp. LBUM 1486]